VLGWLAIGLGLVVIGFALRGRLPSPGSVAESLEVADTGWLVVALGAELCSMAMFGRQQRRLLTAFGVTMPRHRALALAYSRSAISISMPAGSAVSAAYAFRQFRTVGVGRRAAVTVMVLSGLLSMGALVLLYVTGVLAAGAVRLAEAWRAHPALIESTIAMAVALLLLIAFLVWPMPRTVHDAPVRHPDRLAHLAERAPRLAALATPVVDAVRSSRSVAGRDWALALAAATANWLTDLLCLAAAARAFHLPLSLVELAAVYLTVQVVRQIPITPGGIGIIEVSLLAGLISAGADEAPAAATVLAYRLLSFWLIIPMGLVGWLVLRRTGPTGTSRSTASSASPASSSVPAATNEIGSPNADRPMSSGWPCRSRTQPPADLTRNSPPQTSSASPSWHTIASSSPVATSARSNAGAHRFTRRLHRDPSASLTCASQSRPSGE
jgi:uncharacterized membrane protein YbhN (UPF0104 family)